MHWSMIFGVFLTLASHMSSVGNAVDTSTAIPSNLRDFHRNDPRLIPGDFSEEEHDSDDSDNDEDMYSYDRTQENPDLSRLAGLVIQDESRLFAAGLRRLSNEEMRVTAIQGMFDSLAYSEGHPDYQVKLSELAQQMQSKLDKYTKVLRPAKMLMENLYQQHRSNHPVDYRFDCCKMSASDLRWDEAYQGSLNHNITCDLLPAVLPHTVFDAGRNISEVFQMNAKYVPNIKWQYFVTTEGIHNEYPAHNYPTSDCSSLHDTRRRGVLLTAAYQWRKNVIIVIDIGNSLSAVQLKIAKTIAKHILFSLSDNDWVGVVAVSADVKFAPADKCLLDRLMQLNYETKLYLANFIDILEKDASTVNHSLAFSAAFSMTRGVFAEDTSADILVAYISRGLLSSLIEPKEVLTVIGYENVHSPHRVIINTYAVVDDTKPVMYERTFLQDVADQNFSKYQVERYVSMPSRRGRMTSVNSTQSISVVIGDPFAPFNWTVSNRPVVTLPRKDEILSGVVVSILWPCLHEGQLFGVVGVDVHMTDITDNVMYSVNDNSYVFVMDKHGFTVVHPLLDRPAFMNIQPLYTNITYFENVAQFNDVLRLMLREPQGRATIVVSTANNSSYSNSNNLFQSVPSTMHITYYFQHVTIEFNNNETVYVMVMRVIDELANHSRSLRTNPAGPGNSHQLIYHRLDLLPTENNCMHFRQLSTMDGSALFLTGAAFIQPFEHVNHNETKRMVQSYLAYLGDVTNLISNPGILEHVRKDVWATAAVNGDWLRQINSSQLNSYIIRRYLATPSGVFRMYPGTLLNKAYDPTKRLWYTRAREHPGRVTLTAPYLDVGGAGYIVTISHTIYEGKSLSMHGPSDKVVAVVGMDMTLKYFYKLLTDQMPVCQSETVRCFIMDDRGYLIAHHGLIEPNVKGPLEEKHITHKEPLVANDILNHRGFVLKKVCNSFVDRTVQRFYQFNTSLDGVITNLVHGEHCARYQITPIVGTNAFLGIVNQTCDIRAFCPCSMVDRLCLNCHRVEQTECECPCECPLLPDFCSSDVLVSRQSCPRTSDEVELAAVDHDISRSLPPCFQSNCEHRHSKDECIGVLGCEWCELELDGDAVVRHHRPHCAAQRICFGGIIGAKMPYNDHVTDRESVATFIDEAVPVPFNKSMPVGPVAGGIMACFVLLALSVYCYRHHSQGRSHQCGGSLPGEGELHDSNNDFEDLDDTNTGHTNIMLSTFDNKTMNPAVMNPYMMNPTYRRPANTPASDLGYSTMTPHGDDTSEQASTTCVESSVVAVVGRERYKPQLLSAATTGILLPSQHRAYCRRPLLADMDDPSENVVAECTELAPPMTVVPETKKLLPHQFVADVQVHSVDVH